jgi:hypothetical protein
LKEIDELTEDEAKKVLNTIHSLLMDNGVELAEPSVASSYPGEAVSGSSIPPILQDFNDRK